MAEHATKLLLVEDSVTSAARLRASFRQLSGANDCFELVHVFRISDALKQLDAGHFDLVFLDLSLPETGGIDSLLQIRKAAPSLPIVVMTDLHAENIAFESLREGAQDYLVKSDLDSRMLIRTIRYAVERKRIDVQLQHQRERQAVLHEVNLAITSTLDLNSVLNLFLDKISRLLPGFAITIRLLDRDSGELKPLACRNLDEQEWKKILPTERRVDRAKTVMAASEPLVILDAVNHPTTSHLDFLRHNGLVSYVGVPMIAQGKSIGVIGFYTRERREFSTEEVERLATLGGQAAVAIHNSQLYERLKTANEALEKTLEIKGVLVGVMAHELKTPLQVIMGAAGLLSGGACGELNEDQHERVRAIESATDELLQVIDGTLNMVSLERGEMHLAVVEISVATLLSELNSEFSDAFRKKKIELIIDLPSGDCRMKTDRIKLKEILRNLLENARKFTQKGKVTVRFSFDTTRDQVEYTVSDTGIGMKKEILPKIFDLFYQAEPGREANDASAGLGLNIVKRMVAALSGEIDVASEVGKGTTFRLRFPKEIPPVGGASDFS